LLVSAEKSNCRLPLTNHFLGHERFLPKEFEQRYKVVRILGLECLMVSPGQPPIFSEASCFLVILNLASASSGEILLLKIVNSYPHLSQ
jgi:hypothetical protein